MSLSLFNSLRWHRMLRIPQLVADGSRQQSEYREGKTNLASYQETCEDRAATADKAQPAPLNRKNLKRPLRVHRFHRHRPGDRPFHHHLHLQAFTIPSSSMENTLLIGDHVFVDRMLLAPATKWIGKLIPYREPRHGDVFVFISSRRARAVCGETHHRTSRRSHSSAGRRGLPQWREADEPYVVSAGRVRTPIATTFPAVPAQPTIEDVTPEWRAELPSYRQERRTGGAAQQHLRHGRQS